MSPFNYVRLTLIASALASGCSTMNSEFSCKATASDSCLTIEKVDEMTRFADDRDTDYRPRTRIIKSPVILSQSLLLTPFFKVSLPQVN